MDRLKYTRRQNLLIWLNHACLNAGAALHCLQHMLKPPQLGHGPEAIKFLAETNPWDSFFIGLQGD